MKELVRRTALALLDDDYGITNSAFHGVKALLVQTDNKDVVAAVKSTEGRCYIEKVAAESLVTK